MWNHSIIGKPAILCKAEGISKLFYHYLWYLYVSTMLYQKTKTNYINRSQLFKEYNKCGCNGLDFKLLKLNSRELCDNEHCYTTWKNMYTTILESYRLYNLLWDVS